MPHGVARLPTSLQVNRVTQATTRVMPLTHPSGGPHAIVRGHGVLVPYCKFDGGAPGEVSHLKPFVELRVDGAPLRLSPGKVGGRFARGGRTVQRGGQARESSKKLYPMTVAWVFISKAASGHWRAIVA